MRATAHQMLELAVLCDLGGALVTAICALRDDLPMIEKVRVLAHVQDCERRKTGQMFEFPVWVC